MLIVSVSLRMFVDILIFASCNPTILYECFIAIAMKKLRVVSISSYFPALRRSSPHRQNP